MTAGSAEPGPATTGLTQSPDPPEGQVDALWTARLSPRTGNGRSHAPRHGAFETPAGRPDGSVVAECAPPGAGAGAPACGCVRDGGSRAGVRLGRRPRSPCPRFGSAAALAAPTRSRLRQAVSPPAPCTGDSAGTGRSASRWQPARLCCGRACQRPSHTRCAHAYCTVQTCMHAWLHVHMLMHTYTRAPTTRAHTCAGSAHMHTFTGRAHIPAHSVHVTDEHTYAQT